jgi:ligand-binding sensor domain-containing protein
VRTIFLLLILCVGIGTLFAQADPTPSLEQLVRDKWSIKDGLPDGTIQAITQTKDGYLWIGTKRGLTRFDGQRFFLYDMDNTPALPANDIRSLSTSPDGTLYIATIGGVVRFSNRQFEILSNWREGSPRTLRYVYSSACDSSGRLLIGVSGMGVWELKGNAFEEIASNQPQGLGAIVNGIAIDRAGGVWAATREGVVHYAGGTSRRFRTSEGLANDWVNCLAFDSRGTLWAGTREGLSYLSGEAFVPFGKTQGVSQAEIRALQADHQGTLWVGTSGDGLCRISNGQMTCLGQNGERESLSILAFAIDTA